MADSPVDLTGVLRPVKQGNAFEETVERLLAVIKLGMVAAGERFPPERDLAAQLGISRPTLRDALGELQRAGYVEARRGRSGGTFVTYTPPAPGHDELRRIAREDGARLADALTFRLAVETGAAEILAGRLAGTTPDAAGPGPGELRPSGFPRAPGESGATGESRASRASGASGAADDPRQILLARLADVNAASPQDYRRLDTLFHLTIAELTGSGLLLAACTDARMRLNDLLNAIPVLQRNIDHTAAQHAAIVTAILDGDARQAGLAVAEHLAGTGALLRGFLT
ncbi:MAG TPA: GntR family transcriptional regulator [Streptosporangiaceae bacterium]|nr:GntR family transcriptional regulator [Streptosporangiaceae bacterium]